MHADLIWVITAAPDDNDVVAGPMGFIIFVALCLAVAVLGISLNKHLKKARRAADEGAFGDPVVSNTDSTADPEASKSE